MSNIYHTEPPTQGKVLLKTTYGDIDIELWPKEAPLACRNFIQLALEGYYDKTKINRVIKEFMVQFGDPTGGESIWGRPFKDEIHGRLLFNHRGQLAMANESVPNSNKSQFFVTLAACEWLNRKHTIFGKVTGDTIYNLLRLGESDVDGSDRPVEPIELLGVEVLWNPFEDIVPR
jgi:peptidyl-prolyl cis-trans isomerase SDCCAG10